MKQTLIDGRYVIEGLLGSGGMGRVYLARDEILGRQVALKVLKEQYAENEEFVERFRREAQNAAALSHPNIVSLYDMGEDARRGGTPYIAMEYIPGGTLGERIAREEGALDVVEAVAIAAQIALALGEAHRRGMVHRDVKPHNVLLVGDAPGVGGYRPAPPGTSLEAMPLLGDVKVGDFGIARASEATATTGASLIFGTARYLSPEQAKGEPVGPKGDLYSLGVTLYEMLTGRVPFDAENPIAVAMKHVSELPPSPKEVNPKVPQGLDALTLRLLSKDPKERHADAAELVSDLLTQVRSGLPPAEVPPARRSAAELSTELPAKRGETRGAPLLAVLRDDDPDDAGEPPRRRRQRDDERTDNLLAATVFYGRGKKRLRRIPLWVLLLASAAAVAILLGLLSVARSQDRSQEDASPQKDATSPQQAGAAIGTHGAGSENEAAFVHRATGQNISGNSTYIDHPLANGNPNAIISVTPNWDPAGTGGTYDNHPIGVWYDSDAQRWAVFNQDRAAMPEGAAFNVRCSEK